MVFTHNHLQILCDFPIKIVREWEREMDILVVVNNRCINFIFEETPLWLHSRIQFPSVRSILFRIQKAEENSIGTIHFLRSQDLHSTMANFEINYKDYYIVLQDKATFISMEILKKSKQDVFGT